MPSVNTVAVKPINASCAHCQPGPEYYRMVYNLYKFDVDAARKIVSDGRESFLLSEADVAHSLNWSHIIEEHIDHVSLDYPGIVAYYWHPEPDGSLTKGSVLIDGHHRAAKAQRMNLDFYVQVLSENESRLVTLRSPNHPTMAEFWKKRRRRKR